MTPPRQILLLFSILLFSSVRAQQLSFINYTIHDGLVANPVRNIYQDSKGFIWIGTFEGLSRYDGYMFTNYTSVNGLSHNVINSIIEVDNRLLIAVNNGSVDVIQNNVFQKGFMAESAVNVISKLGDRLLLATDNDGFYEYRNDTIILPSQEKSGASLGEFLSVDDSLFLANAIDHGLVIVNKNFSVRYFSRSSSLYFFDLVRDSKQRLWACTSDGLKSVRVTTGKNLSIDYVALPAQFNIGPLKSRLVTSMIEEKDGSYWVGTMKGLVHLLPDGNFQVYNEKDGLPSANIT